MKHALFYKNSHNDFQYESPSNSLRRTSNKIGFLLCATIAAMYLFSYAAQWYLIGIGYQKTQYNEAISILNYLLNGAVSVFSLLLPELMMLSLLPEKWLA